MSALTLTEAGENELVRAWDVVSVTTSNLSEKVYTSQATAGCLWTYAVFVKLNETVKSPSSAQPSAECWSTRRGSGEDEVRMRRGLGEDSVRIGDTHFSQADCVALAVHRHAVVIVEISAGRIVYRR